ncbi:MAG: hypothetical protein ABI759_24430 [Candidatus Solibacter sp.]
MNRKTLLIVGGSLTVAAFLLGFVPQYRKVKDLEDQLDATRQELKLEQSKLQMADLSLLIGLVYGEGNLRNFGLAGRQSTKLFDRVRNMAGPETDPNRRAFLQESLAGRDAVTAGLAKGDPGTLPAVQDLVQRALKASPLAGSDASAGCQDFDAPRDLARTSA